MHEHMTDRLNDYELVRKCLYDDDGTAWEIFVRKYSKLIWSSIHKTFCSYTFHYCKEDIEDIEDIYSFVFLSLIEDDFRRLRQFRNENACSLSTWLTVITVRMTIDYMRKDKKHFFIESGGEERDVLELIPDRKNCAEKILEEKQTGESLKKSIDALLPQDKIIYDMLYNRGISYEETAKMLGMSVESVYTRKHRIIARIKKNIEGV